MEIIEVERFFKTFADELEAQLDRISRTLSNLKCERM